MSYLLIEKTIEITGTATALALIKNAHIYSEVMIKSITFLDDQDNPIKPTAGTLEAFTIVDAEQVNIKEMLPWSLTKDGEWFDVISIEQFNGNEGQYFSLYAPPDFMGISFFGINAEVKKIRVRWMAIK